MPLGHASRFFAVFPLRCVTFSLSLPPSKKKTDERQQNRFYRNRQFAVLKHTKKKTGSNNNYYIYSDLAEHTQPH